MMTLGAQEFLRRFLLYVLPRGFVRIRSFGFLANRRRATLLPLCQRLLADQPKTLPCTSMKDAGSFLTSSVFPRTKYSGCPVSRGNQDQRAEVVALCHRPDRCPGRSSSTNP
jgi:hypothetical protein